MTSRILFIGAGASYGARLEQQRQPPLGPDLCRWLREVAPAFGQDLSLIQYHSEIEAAANILSNYSGEQNYESLVSRLNREGRARLSRLLLITFTDICQKRQHPPDASRFDFGFRNQADGYDLLLSKLKIGDGSWSIVSLNYDLLIEEALRRAGISFLYPHFPLNFGENQEKLKGVRLYKPHGSINFYAHGDHKIYHREPLPGDDRGLPTEYYKDGNGNFTPTYPIVVAAPPGVENVLHIADSASICEPVMANYTKGKASDTNQETLERVRQEAISAIGEAGEVVVVGVRPIQDAGDDAFVSRAFSVLPRATTYISGSGAECEIVKKLCPTVRAVSGGLREYLLASRAT
jgi:SIR2-like domain